jgi:hypothetical protein
MNKNIYVDLADKLDSAGLFQESDDLMKVFSSSASMIKTAQSPKLSSVLAKANNLTGFTDIIGVEYPLMGAGASAIATAVASAKSFEYQLKDEFEEFRDVPDEPDYYNKKTIDPTIVSQVKQQADRYKGLPNNQKTLVEVYIPNNQTPFDVSDPSSYVKEKYYLPDNIDKTIRGVVKPTKNTLITKMNDPYYYIKDLMNGNQVETIKVPKTKLQSFIPSGKEGTKALRKEARWSGIKKSILAALIGGIAGGAYKLAEFNIHKKYIPKNVMGQYNRFINKYNLSEKSRKNSAQIVQEFSNKLDSLLSRCDGLSTTVPNPVESKEKFRDNVLSVFKEEIGFGKPASSEGSNTNTNSTTQKSNSGAPSSKSRSQTLPSRPSQPKPAPSGGPIKVEGM